METCRPSVVTVYRVEQIHLCIFYLLIQQIHQTIRVPLCVCLQTADILVVENPGGSLALKLLLLQDALEVLHALLRVFHVSRQVAVQEADGVTEHWHAGAHSTFIPLWHRPKPSSTLREPGSHTLLWREVTFSLKQNWTNEGMNKIWSVMESVSGMSGLTVLSAVFLPQTGSLLIKDQWKKHHQYLMLKVKCTVGWTGWVCGFFTRSSHDSCDPLKHKRCWIVKYEECVFMSGYSPGRIEAGFPWKHGTTEHFRNPPLSSYFSLECWS